MQGGNHERAAGSFPRFKFRAGRRRIDGADGCAHRHIPRMLVVKWVGLGCRARLSARYRDGRQRNAESPRPGIESDRELMESIMDEKTGVVAGTRLPQHYGSDPVGFSGHPDALLERHLLFNDLIDPSTAGARQTFEAAARSVRDVLSRRWALTQRTYHRENPKRIYYLSPRDLAVALFQMIESGTGGRRLLRRHHPGRPHPGHHRTHRTTRQRHGIPGPAGRRLGPGRLP